MMQHGADVRWQRWVRFLCGGAVNTLLSYLLYLGLIQIMPYQGAYLVAYVAGVLLAYWLNSRFVFRVPLSWRGMFTYPVVYLVQYLAAAALLELLVRFVSVRPAYAPLLVTAILMPLTYLMNKVVLRRSAATRSGPGMK